MNVWYINSMLGTLRLEEEDDALCGVQLCPDGVPDLEPLPRKVCETPLLQETEEQLNEYFAGARREFDLPLAPKGTAFQKAVWGRDEQDSLRRGAHLRSAGRGPRQTKGRPRRGRGLPLHPIAIIQPCHRVVGANGSLTGYAYGLEVKEYLLELELD